ncbi:hypothetical protein KUCAC02_022047 [Chaenocephalus aceratus]|nr:hypothetical protein KUCAC02_022047 [Chaenocephalus aceratus]
MLSEKHLISVCADNNHVRTWTVTRFRGMISTQPGSTPLTSFKVLSLDDVDGHGGCSAGTEIGPYGERDDQQVFIQRVVPDSDINSTSGCRPTGRGVVCEVRSVDGTSITAFMVHECEGSSRIGSRPRRYLFSGHGNGSIQMWDLTTAMEIAGKVDIRALGGPTEEELLELLDQCDLALTRTPDSTPRASTCSLYSQIGDVLRMEPPLSFSGGSQRRRSFWFLCLSVRQPPSTSHAPYVAMETSPDETPASAESSDTPLPTPDPPPVPNHHMNETSF